MNPVDVALLLLRLTVGLLMLVHGFGNLFGWLRGPGIDGTAAIFEQLGFVPGRRFTFIAAATELGAGALFASGALLPAATAAIVGLMITTIRTAHRGNGLFYFNGGWEYNATLLIIAVAVTLQGPGAMSVDAGLDLGLHGYGWTAASLAVGLVAAATVLTLRWRTGLKGDGS